VAWESWQGGSVVSGVAAGHPWIAVGFDKTVSPTAQQAMETNHQGNVGRLVPVREPDGSMWLKAPGSPRGREACTAWPAWRC